MQTRTLTRSAYEAAIPPSMISRLTRGFGLRPDQVIDYLASRSVTIHGVELQMEKSAIRDPGVVMLRSTPIDGHPSPSAETPQEVSKQRIAAADVAMAKAAAKLATETREAPPTERRDVPKPATTDDHASWLAELETPEDRSAADQWDRLARQEDARPTAEAVSHVRVHDVDDARSFFAGCR